MRNSDFNRILLFLMLSVITLLGCDQSKPKIYKGKGTFDKLTIPASVKESQIVDVVPFDDMPTYLTAYFFNQFIRIHPSAKLHHPRPLPKTAYYAARDRYRADSLIRQLAATTPDGHVTLALTTKRISTTKGGIKDWGIIGLGYCPGKSCIVSTSLLHVSNLKEQLFKVALHELAHTQGLDHCKSVGCYMRDAEGHNIVDQGTDFCPACKEFLKKKGWVFK